MGAFHELDLLVLRPLKKKKFFAHPPLRARARRFQNTQSHRELNTKSWIPKIRKHHHEGEGPKNTQKNKNLKFEIYFLSYKPRKRGILKGASPDGKNKFFF